MKKILITGVSGLLGNNLARYFRDSWCVMGFYHCNPVDIDGVRTRKVDLTSKEMFSSIFSNFDPDVVIHSASATDVDRCEVERDETKKINFDATRLISDRMKESRSKLIYISTDSVYEGTKGDYCETDEVFPQNYYGVSKHEGEVAVLEYDNSLILRTNIFGWNVQNKNSLAEWIVGELRNGRGIEGFVDADFSTIYTFELAKLIEEMIIKDLVGVYNCGSHDSITKYDFAKLVANKFGLDDNLIKASSIDDHNFNAKRGKRMSLNVGKLESALEKSMPTVEVSVNAFFEDYRRGMRDDIKRVSSINSVPAPRLTYGKQSIDDEDIQAVVDVLKSNSLTQGPKIAEFENALCEFVGAKHAVVYNSGTSALHAACLSIGLGQGDETVTSPITFVASANCAAYCGATPVFADIDEKTYNLSASEIESRLTERTRAIIPVHFAGQSCDMEAIRRVRGDAEKLYGKKIFLIEDACHALGSLCNGKKVGSGAFSDMTVMSFHPVKHITTGEGGVVFTNDEGLNRKLRLFRSHGITNEPGELINDDMAFETFNSELNSVQNPWYYEQLELGYNYRMNDIECALGLSQLKKMDRFTKRRREIVNSYNEAFSELKKVQIPFELRPSESNYHLYVLLIDFDSIGIERARFMKELRSKGMQTQVHYIPVHLQPFYRNNYGTTLGDCPKAEEYYRKCLSIPLYPDMTDEDVDIVIKEISNLVRGSE